VPVTNPPGAFWPSERQQLLLISALADDSTAVEAWQEVRPQISIDELEPGSFQLLPLIYGNLSEAGQDDVDLQRLKGIYRRTWVKNNLLLARTKAIGEALAEIQIRAEFIEGVAIATRFYRELGLRPTSMIDVLVDAIDGQEAVAVLKRAGWTERPELMPSHSSSRYVFDENANACVLRTRLATDLATATPDTRHGSWLWPTGECHRVQDTEFSVPPPTETLFAVCVSHARAARVPNTQWIVDAKMAMQHAEIDWERLLDLARQTRQVSRMRDALDFFAQLPGSKPPREVCDQLAAAPVSRRLRLAHRCTTGAVRGPARLSTLIGDHLATSDNRSPLGVIAAFPGFLRDRWGLARTWQVPVAACQRAIRLLGNRQPAT
jgi:Uncharacterised nucleotidyltransferase